MSQVPLTVRQMIEALQQLPNQDVPVRMRGDWVYRVGRLSPPVPNGFHGHSGFWVELLGWDAEQARQEFSARQRALRQRE